MNTRANSNSNKISFDVIDVNTSINIFRYRRYKANITSFSSIIL